MILIEEYRKSDWCVDNPWRDGYLADDYEDMFEDIEPSNILSEAILDIQNAIETAKEIKVYEKNYFKLDYSCIKDMLDEDYSINNIPEFVIDYGDNWGMGYWEVEPERMDIVYDFCKDVAENGYTDEKIKTMVDSFNEHQHYYTNGKFVGTLDISKDVEEYINEYYEEEYEQYKELFDKKLSSI